MKLSQIMLSSGKPVEINLLRIQPEVAHNLALPPITAASR
jgi:hypothetical protein